MSSMYPPYGGGAPPQTCQRCGTPLPPNELYCSNCGNYNTPPSVTPPQSAPGNQWGLPSTAYGSYPGQSAPPAQPQWGQPQASFPNFGAPDASGQPYGASANYYGGGAPSAPSYPPGTGVNGGFQAGGYPPGTGVNGGFQAGGYPPGTGVNGGFQAGGYPPPGGGYIPPKKSGPRVGLIVGLVALVLLLVGGGFLAYSVLKKGPVTGTTTPTPAVATPSPTPSTPPLFKDTFANNNNGWDLQSTPGHYSVKVGNGSLILEDDNHKVLTEAVPSKTFDDFRLAVDINLSKGTQDNGYGVFFRVSSNQNSDLASYYGFELYGDSTYGIFKGVTDAAGSLQRDKLVGYPSDVAIKGVNTTNHVEIIAKGSTLTFRVNGKDLKVLTDTSYKSGSMALFVSNLTSAPAGAAATFTNLAIYPAP